MKTQEVVVSFMADCRLRGLSQKTLEGYNQHTQALNELSTKFPPKPEVIQLFLAELSIHSADAHYRTFSAVDNYAHKRFKTRNFMCSVTRPRVPKQIMPTISESQLRMLAWRLERASPRDRAIFCLLIDTAIRSGELSNLKLVDIHESMIVVHGKTGYRQVPISPVARDLLLSLPVHEDGYVFHGTGRYKNFPLKKTGVYDLVGKYVRLTGYSGDKQFGPQLIRRSFGRFWFKDGGDPKSLQLIYGHSSLTTTLNYYAAFQAEDVREMHHKHTPIRVFEQIA